MEYTDAPPQPAPVSFDTMQCPFCGTTLPANAQACTNCDWTLAATKPAEPKASDAMAILLSITPTAIAFAILAAIASAGWGILMLIPYWGAVMLHVWAIDDRVTQKPDEGEQY